MSWPKQSRASAMQPWRWGQNSKRWTSILYGCAAHRSRHSTGWRWRGHPDPDHSRLYRIVAEAVAPAGQPSPRGRREVRRAQQCRRITDPAEQAPARGNALRGVVVDEHGKFGVANLQRRMHHVAGNDRVRAGLADLHREMAHRVAGRGKQLHDVTELIIAVDHLMPPGLDNRQDGVDDPWLRSRIGPLLFRPIRQLLLAEQVLRLREGRHPPPVLQLRVP